MSKGSELRHLCGHGGLQLQKACTWPPGWRNFLPKMKQKNHARQTANTMVGRQVDGWMDRWLNEQMSGKRDGWMDEKMDN